MLAEKQKPKMLNGGRRNVRFLTNNYTKKTTAPTNAGPSRLEIMPSAIANCK